MYRKKSNIFGAGSMFGGNGNPSRVSDEKLAEILNGYNIAILTGNATSTETLTMIDGGTALSKDILSFSGGSSFN